MLSFAAAATQWKRRRLAATTAISWSQRSSSSTSSSLFLRILELSRRRNHRLSNNNHYQEHYHGHPQHGSIAAAAAAASAAAAVLAASLFDSSAASSSQEIHDHENNVLHPTSKNQNDNNSNNNDPTAKRQNQTSQQRLTSSSTSKGMGERNRQDIDTDASIGNHHHRRPPRQRQQQEQQDLGHEQFSGNSIKWTQPSSSSLSYTSWWNHTVPTLTIPTPTTLTPSTTWSEPAALRQRPEDIPAVKYQFSRLRRKSTLRRLEETAHRDTVDSKYQVDWKKPLGEGAFGAVYIGKDRTTGELVAIKKISKKATDNVSFQREMDALLHLRAAGGHPHICSLRENFDQGSYFYLVLDLIVGGELFDHLCAAGAYSEADAARLVREVASALAFLHGIGIVHGDIKPENLMLSTDNPSDAVIKIVDFGCAQVSVDSHDADWFDLDVLNSIPNENKNGTNNNTNSNSKRTLLGSFQQQQQQERASANTPAYSPPEILDPNKRKRQPPTKGPWNRIDPSFDMWALGVILYIMLTGVHPFDLYGNATDEEIEHSIITGKKPPLDKSPLTAHLSKDAIAVIDQLLQWDPSKRLTANELLQNPWVRGDTARTKKMADSDKRLSAYKAFKTKLEARVFADMVALGDARDAEEVAKKTSLIERSFHMLDPEHRGYVTTKELRKLNNANSTEPINLTTTGSTPEGGDEHLSLSGFADLLAENMKNRYFPKGHIVYTEGEKGDVMYFINSGTVEVFTRDGFNRSLRKGGDWFGEGALLHPQKIRSASIRCVTPVHAIEISREYFEKYIASDEGAKLNLREKDKARKRQRAKTILRATQNMTEKTLKNGEYVFQAGEDQATEMYIIEEGELELLLKDGRRMLTLQPGEMCGEHSLIFGRPRNVSAQCISSQCKLHVLRARDFFALLESHPSLKESVREICLRRDFQKALCAKTKRPFPKDEKELRKAFDAVDINKSDNIELQEIRSMIQQFDSTYSESDIREILNSLDLDESGSIGWAEFKRIFGMF